jgi:hypothetical protein
MYQVRAIKYNMTNAGHVARVNNMIQFLRIIVKYKENGLMRSAVLVGRCTVFVGSLLKTLRQNLSVPSSRVKGN